MNKKFKNASFYERGLGNIRKRDRGHLEVVCMIIIISFGQWNGRKDGKSIFGRKKRIYLTQLFCVWLSEMQLRSSIGAFLKISTVINEMEITLEWKKEQWKDQYLSKKAVLQVKASRKYLVRGQNDVKNITKLKWRVTETFRLSTHDIFWMILFKWSKIRRRVFLNILHLWQRCDDFE